MPHLRHSRERGKPRQGVTMTRSVTRQGCNRLRRWMPTSRLGNWIGHNTRRSSWDGGSQRRGGSSFLRRLGREVIQSSRPPSWTGLSAGLDACSGDGKGPRRKGGVFRYPPTCLRKQRATGIYRWSPSASRWTRCDGSFIPCRWCSDRSRLSPELLGSPTGRLQACRSPTAPGVDRRLRRPARWLSAGPRWPLRRGRPRLERA